MEPVALGFGVVLAGLVLAVLAVAGILRSPWAYGQFQDVIADMNRDNQELRTELAATDQAIRELRRELQRAEQKIAQLEDHTAAVGRHSELLADRLRALGVMDIPPAPALPEGGAVGKSGGSVWVEEGPVTMAKKIATLFDLDEIAGLAFELGLSDVVTGDTPAKRARSLVSHAVNHDRLERLRELCRAERPAGGF